MKESCIIPSVTLKDLIIDPLARADGNNKCAREKRLSILMEDRICVIASRMNFNR